MADGWNGLPPNRKGKKQGRKIFRRLRKYKYEKPGPVKMIVMNAPDAEG